MKVKTKKIKALVPRPQNITLGKNCMCDSSRGCQLLVLLSLISIEGVKKKTFPKKTLLIHSNHIK